MEKLSSGILTVEVSRHGAELCSIRKNGTEYLWQADPAYWKRHSPVLFPIVGSVWNGKFMVEGKEYPMSQHGFARDMDFDLVSHGQDEVLYRLVSSEDTLSRYPFPFVLEIGYRLSGSMVEVRWRVSNPGDRDMYFQIGAHPAFNWPGFDRNAPVRGYFLLEAGAGMDDGAKVDGRFRYILIKEKGCADPDTAYALDTAGYSPEADALAERYGCSAGHRELLPVDGHTFDRDALIFEDSQIGKVTMLAPDGTPWLSLSFDAPLVGLWSPAAGNAPFVCIEPWYGRCDRAGFGGEFSRRDWMQHLKPHQSFDASYCIDIIPGTGQGR